MSNTSQKEIKWLKAEENPWQVPVLDLRSVVPGMMSFSTDPEKAKNSISYSRDDGIGFINQNPPNNRKISISIRYPIDTMLLDGVLFTPNIMEDKWAIFYHTNKIIFVRSWLREVAVVAKIVQTKTHIEVTEIHGVFVSEDESPESTKLYFDCLIRNLVYRVVYPIPINEKLAQTPQDVVSWCFTFFGKMAMVATPYTIPPVEIHEPMRSISLFHIAIAQKKVILVKEFLENGVPIDILAQDGLSPMHWSLVTEDFDMALFLLQQGADIDTPSKLGATPLMNAVQEQFLDRIQFLLDHGADVNKADHRGFTSLHRSAEVGNVEITNFLLKNGADPRASAEGYTPMTLAENRNHLEIIKILKKVIMK